MFFLLDGAAEILSGDDVTAGPVQCIALGEATLESLLEVQELYDNHFMKSEVWDGRRG
ncbi:hypothetical protein [Streptomyces sp. NPDC059010]|uniref:hypothetical protein n=1 Tax=Streptomyces sp. NPDC059010 TaxID=3346695 RepID=UPI00368BC303